MQQKTIVISGINITNSGILSIMTDCLTELENYSRDRDIKIIALVNSKTLFTISNIEYLEFPKSKKSWLFRIYYEYFFFKKLSKKIKPDIWFSLHDLSPNIVCKKKFVYCHNPSPFYNPTLKDWVFGFKISFFSWFYKYMYQINIKSNTAVFVQQNWIKEQFEKWFSLSNCKVAYPISVPNTQIEKVILDSGKIHFFYPGFPRMFKNFEHLFEAILLLPEELKNKIQLHVTISGDENVYSKFLFHKYSKHDQFKFIGAISRKKVFGYYESMDALLFPSKLETWGLPITETIQFNKPLFVSDLPYANETVGNYGKVCFFDSNNPQDLSEKITLLINQKLIFETNNRNYTPDFIGWEPVFNFIFAE
ncbi:MAG: glycosyltransferase [Bacteroidota bacterium]